MRTHAWRRIAIALLPMLACKASDTARVQIAGESFVLELALDPEKRHRGLGGRTSVAPDGGMLFVFEKPRPLAVVMRDCPIPLDVAFLDAEARVLAVHQMRPEAPRAADETHGVYEARLREYPSGGPAQFILETAGGRLAELALAPGQRVDLDAAGLVRRLRR